jgi:hypothetical protein
MPCDFGRATLLRFGFVTLQVMALAAAVAGPAQSQQEPDKAAGQELIENSIDRWNRMSPEEREQELAKLPPDRARLIRQRIWQYNHLPPEEQQALRERYRTFSKLPPEQQQIVRDRLREFSQLPPGRQPVLHNEVKQLRLLPEAQRQARFNSEEFRGRFSPQERQIIKDLLAYLPNLPAEPVHTPPK